jgi:methionyl-tRNA formyltransferase
LRRRILKLIFAGTPEFAAVALDALLAAGHTVALTLTQPDRPAGRGLKLRPSAVKAIAFSRGLPLAQPATLKERVIQEQLRAIGADAIVVAAYGLMLPEAVLAMPPRGCINVHASLLPRWRGAAPIQRAVLAGDSNTGITIMQMDAGLDTGAMLLKRSLPIAAEDNAATLHDKLARLGSTMIVEALARFGDLSPTSQPVEGVTHAAKIAKHEALLDWRQPAVELERRVRAFNPYPVARATLDGIPLSIWCAMLAEGSGEPGRVLASNENGIVVACGDNALRLTQLQKPGGKRLPARDFLHGFPVAVGSRFEIG